MSTKLEELAIAIRKGLVVINTYNNEDDANNYNDRHTRALSDKLTPNNGKGTGVFMDTYNGGSDFDINGNPTYGGSGRIPLTGNNLAKWGYGPDSPYTKPDTSLNKGQVNF